MTRGTERRRPLPVRIYAALTRTLPVGLREDIGRVSTDLLHDMYRVRLRTSGRWAALRLWLWSVVRLLGCALASRLEAGGARSGHGLRTNGRPTGMGGGTMNGWLQDLRYAGRSLRKSPGFALTAVLLLATGIGATTTIFSVVDAVVLRPLPYPEADRLVHFDNGAHPYPGFHDWRDFQTLEMVSAARDFQVDLTGESRPERLPAVAVSEDFFELFGASAHVGRLLQPADYPGDRSVAVLGHGFWARLGSDPDLVGSDLLLDGRPTTVVGVLAPDFEPPLLETGSSVDVWFALDDGGDLANDHGYYVLGVAARLAEGATLAAAQEEATAHRTATAQAHPDQYLRRDGSVDPLPLVAMHHATVRDVRATLFLLLGAVGMMLLIACVNVANLFLARGTARTREIALRGAIGASRLRIARQVLSEALTVSLAGGALGVIGAFGGVEVLRSFLPGDLPRIETLTVDVRVLWFSVAASVLTGVLFGALPAVQALRADVGEALKDSAAAKTGSRGGRRVRSALVVAQIALAMILVAGAGLLFRSLASMVSVEPGFEVADVAVLPLRLDAGYEPVDREQFARRLLAGAQAVPGADAVALAWEAPFRSTGFSRCCWRTRVVGDPALHDEERPTLSIVHPVSDAYFETLRAPLVAGRSFDGDAEAGARVAIINRTAAEMLFGSDQVVGRSIQLSGEALEVVGVVEGVHHWGLSQPVEQAVYVPYFAYGTEDALLELVVRSSATLPDVAQALRQVVWDIDPDLPVGPVTTMEAQVGSSLATPRFLSGLLGTFALVALVLACGGIYGSMLYNVSQRRRELGIRIALGAPGAEVLGLVLRQGMLLTLTGVGLGLLLGVSVSGLMERLVWGIEPTDPTTFGVAGAALAVVSVLASAVPALRAARTDPLDTLRSE